MEVPAYYRTRRGRVFRVERIRLDLADGRARYTLRAHPLMCSARTDAAPVAELAEEVSTDALLDRLRRGQEVPTAEYTFGQLWQRLRLDLETP